VDEAGVVLVEVAEVSVVSGLDSMALMVLVVLVQDLEVDWVFGESLDSPGAG